MCLNPLYWLNPKKPPFFIFKSRLRERYENQKELLKCVDDDFKGFLHKYVTDKGFLSQLGRESLLLPRNADIGAYMQELPCRKCLECRMQQARQWTARCMLEARQHKSNYFITFTYDDDHVPRTPDGFLTLFYRHWQLFMKRLRKQIDYPVRYRVAAEYGERTRRPHYHALLFGLKLTDLQFLYAEVKGRKVYDTHHGGKPHYNSPWLRSIWQYGNIDVAAVEHGSIRYVNDYMTKYELDEVKDDWQALAKFREYFPHQSACYKYAVKLGVIAPPVQRQSSRPAIGRAAYDEVKKQLLETDAYPSGFKLPVRHIPYFDKLLYLEHPEIKDERQRRRANLAKAVAYDIITDPETARQKRAEILLARVNLRKCRDL